MTLKRQIAELTEEVRKLRAEVADLRARPAPVQFVPYVSPPLTWPPYHLPYIGDAPPYFTITCETES